MAKLLMQAKSQMRTKFKTSADVKEPSSGIISIKKCVGSCPYCCRKILEPEITAKLAGLFLPKLKST